MKRRHAQVEHINILQHINYKFEPNIINKTKRCFYHNLVSYE